MFRRVTFRLNNLPILMEVYLSWEAWLYTNSLHKYSTQILKQRKGKKGTVSLDKGNLSHQNILLFFEVKCSYSEVTTQSTCDNMSTGGTWQFEVPWCPGMCTILMVEVILQGDLNRHWIGAIMLTGSGTATSACGKQSVWLRWYCEFFCNTV